MSMEFQQQNRVGTFYLAVENDGTVTMKNLELSTDDDDVATY